MEFELDGSLKEWVKDKPLSILQLDPADRAVLRIADERDAIQKKTFTKWVNKHLKKTYTCLHVCVLVNNQPCCSPTASRHVGDLFVDLRDGHNLISLLEVLSGEHLPRERGRMRFHMLQNVQMALDFLRYKKIKLVNIRAEDIVDGNPKLTLGLIWTIILHFQRWRRKISDIVVGQEPNVTAREALLRWARRSTARYPGVRVTDFTGSWRDGLAFSALIHRNRPDLVDWRGARASQPRERLDRVFHVAEREYGVTRLLDPEDVDTPEPDEKSLITYISSLYDVFPEPPAIHPLYDAEAQRRSAEYRELANSLHMWIREKMSLMQDRSFPPTLIEMKKLAADSTKFKNEEVPPRYRDKQRLAYIFRDLQKYFEAVGEVDMEPELHIEVVEKNWNRLIMLHQEREQAIIDEIKRLERLQRLAEKVHREMKSTDNRLEELERRVEEEARRLDRLHPLEAKHAVDLLEQDIRNTEIQIQNIFTDVHSLTEGRYSQAAELQKRVQKLHQRWVALRSLLHKRLVQPLSAVSFPVEERVVTKHRTTVHETRLVETNPHFRALHDCIDWCKAKLKQLQEAHYGSDLPSVQNELEHHQREHKNIEQFQPKVERCVQAKNNFHGEELTLYSQHLGVLQKHYTELLSASSKRLTDLDTFHDFIQSATAELVWLNSKEETEVTRDWSDKNLNVQAIEQYYESLMSDLEKREIQFSAVQDRGEALILEHHPASKTIEAYMSAMQSQWAWLLQLTVCLEVHLKHATRSQQFFREVQQAEQWIAKRDESLNSLYSQSEFSLDEGERLSKGMQELREELDSYGEQVQKLVEQAKEIVPLRQRRQPVNRPFQVTCVCSYKQVNMTIEKGEQCMLYDNSGRVKWRVKNKQGVEAPVPGVCFTLPPPDKDALDAAERLRRLHDQSVSLWHQKQLRLRQNMIFATIKVVKGWDLSQFLEMDQDQRTTIRKALNEDAAKLLSEGDPADPQLRRLKREMAEVNKLFDDLEKRARAEEESKNAGRIFNDQASALQQALDDAERSLNTRIASPLPRDLDSLEHLVLQHKNYEQKFQRLAPDIEQAQQTFRGITLKTPAMRNKLDNVTQKWSQIWNVSNLYIERLKCVEIVLTGLEENTAVISELEVKLASFDELPSDAKALQNVLEELMVLQNAISQQQIAMDQLNEDAHNARRLVEKSRPNHRGSHTDVDRLDAEVNRLNARWTNICGQLVDRIRSAESAYGLAQQYDPAYRNETDFLEESYAKLDTEDPKNLLTKVVERSSGIEAVNVTGGRLIREGKIYEQRLRAFKEQLEDICPSLDASVKKPRRDNTDLVTVDKVARQLETLNNRYSTLVNLLQDRVNRTTSQDSENDVTQRSQTPPAGTTFPVANEPVPGQVTKGERLPLGETVNDGFVKSRPRSPNATDHLTPLQSGPHRGNGLSEAGQETNEPDKHSVSSVTETVTAYRTVTMKTLELMPGYELVNATEVREIGTGCVVKIEEAKERGIVREHSETKEFSTKSVRMAFEEAVERGLVDRATGTYKDPSTGVAIPITEAIETGVLDVSTMDEDTRTEISPRLKQSDDPRTGSTAEIVEVKMTTLVGTIEPERIQVQSIGNGKEVDSSTVSSPDPAEFVKDAAVPTTVPGSTVSKQDIPVARIKEQTTRTVEIVRSESGKDQVVEKGRANGSSSVSLAEAAKLGLTAVIAAPVLAGKAVIDAIEKRKDSKQPQTSTVETSYQAKQSKSVADRPENGGLLGTEVDSIRKPEQKEAGKPEIDATRNEEIDQSVKTVQEEQANLGTTDTPKDGEIPEPEVKDKSLEEPKKSGKPEPTDTKEILEEVDKAEKVAKDEPLEVKVEEPRKREEEAAGKFEKEPEDETKEKSEKADTEEPEKRKSEEPKVTEEPQKVESPEVEERLEDIESDRSELDSAIEKHEMEEPEGKEKREIEQRAKQEALLANEELESEPTENLEDEECRKSESEIVSALSGQLGEKLDEEKAKLTERQEKGEFDATKPETVKTNEDPKADEPSTEVIKMAQESEKPVVAEKDEETKVDEEELEVTKERTDEKPDAPKSVEAEAPEEVKMDRSKGEVVKEEEKEKPEADKAQDETRAEVNGEQDQEKSDLTKSVVAKADEETKTDESKNEVIEKEEEEESAVAKLDSKPDEKKELEKADAPRPEGVSTGGESKAEAVKLQEPEKPEAVKATEETKVDDLKPNVAEKETIEAREETKIDESKVASTEKELQQEPDAPKSEAAITQEDMEEESKKAADIEKEEVAVRPVPSTTEAGESRAELKSDESKAEVAKRGEQDVPKSEEIPKLDASKPDEPRLDASKPEEPKPDASTSDATKPDGSRPDAMKPDAMKPDGSRPDASKPDESKADEPKPDASTFDATKPDAMKSDESRPDAMKPDESKADEPKLDASKPDGSRPDASKPDGSRPDASKPDGSRPDASKPDESRPDAMKPDESRPDASKPDESKADEPKPDASTFDATKPDESRPDAMKPAESRPDESRPDAMKPDESRPDAMKPDGSRPDASKPDESRPDAMKPDESRPDVSKPDESKADEPKPDASKPDEPRLEASKHDEPEPDSSRHEESKPDASKPEEPKPDVAKPEEPKPDVAKPEEPKPDTLKPDAPKTDESKSDSPSTDKAKPGVSALDESEPDSSKINSAELEAEVTERKEQQKLDVPIPETAQQLAETKPESIEEVRKNLEPAEKLQTETTQQPKPDTRKSKDEPLQESKTEVATEEKQEQVSTKTTDEDVVQQATEMIERDKMGQPDKTTTPTTDATRRFIEEESKRPLDERVEVPEHKKPAGGDREVCKAAQEKEDEEEGKDSDVSLARLPTEDLSENETERTKEAVRPDEFDHEIAPGRGEKLFEMSEEVERDDDDEKRLMIEVSSELTSRDVANLGAYDLEKEKFLDPETKELTSFSDFVLNLGVFDPDAVKVKDLSAKTERYVSLREAIGRPLVDRNLGYMVDPKTGKKIPFFEAVSLGLIVQEPMDEVEEEELDVPPVSVDLQVAVDSGLCDPSTCLVRDPETGRTFTLSKAVEEGLINPESISVRDPKTDELVPLAEALESGEPIDLGSAFSKGLLAPDTRKPIALETAIRKGLYDERTGLIEDPLTKQPVNVEESVHRGIVDGTISQCKDSKVGALVPLEEAIGRSLVEVKSGRLRDTRSGELLPLNVALDRGLIFTAPFVLSLIDAIVREYYSPRTRLVMNPVTGEATSVRDALLSGYVDGRTTMIKDDLKERVLSLNEADDIGLVDLDRGTFTYPQETTLDVAFQKGYILSTVKPWSLQEALAHQTYDPRRGTFDIDGGNYTLEEALESGLIGSDSPSIKDPRSGDVISVGEAVKQGLVDPKTGTALDPSGDAQLPFTEALDRGLIVPAKRKISLPEAVFKGLYDPRTGRFTVPETKEKLSTERAIRVGVIDATSAIVRNADGQAITFNEAIKDQLVDPKSGTVVNESGRPIDFREALERGVLVEARRPMTFSEAISKGLLDEKTGRFLDPQAGTYLTLSEAISRNLIDADSVTVKDGRSGFRERITLTEAVRTGFVDGTTGRGKDFTSLREAYDSGVIVDNRAAVSLQRAIHQGLYDEKSGRIVDPGTGRSVTLHEAMRKCLVSPTLPCYWDKRAERLLSLAETCRAGVIDRRAGTFKEPGASVSVPLTTALQLDLIVDIESAGFGLYETILMNMYDPTTGKFTHPSSNERLTLADACHVDLINPIASIVKDTSSNRYVPLTEAVSRGLVDDTKGMYRVAGTEESIDLQEARRMGYVVPSKLPLILEEAVKSGLYQPESGLFIDPTTNDAHDLIDALKIGFLDPETTALKDPTTGQIKSLLTGIEDGTIEPSTGRILDPKTRQGYSVDVALERGLLVTVDKPLTQRSPRTSGAEQFNLSQLEKRSLTREYTIEEAIRLELLDPVYTVTKDPRTGTFVGIGKAIEAGLLDPKATGSIELRLNKPVRQRMRFGEQDVFLSQPLSLDQAIDTGNLHPTTGTVSDPRTGERTSLKNAISLGLIDPDSALVKDTKRKRLINLSDALRQGLIDPETATVQNTETSRVYTLTEALGFGPEPELVVTPRTGLPFIEALEYGYYEPSSGTFHDPFAITTAEYRRPITLKEGMQSGSINTCSAIAMEPPTGKLVSLSEAIDRELIDPVAGRFLEEPPDKSLDFLTALERGFILNREAWGHPTVAGLELLRHISSDDALKLKDKLDSLERRFNDLVTQKNNEDSLPLVQLFHENHNRLMEWTQAALSTFQSAELREEEIIRLEMEISEYRPILDKINAIGPQLYQLSPGEGVAAIEGLVARDNRRFNAIAEQIHRKAERIQLSKQRSLEVIEDIEDLLDWFREADNQLREIEPPSSEPEIIRVQLKERRALNDDVSSQKGRVRDVISTAKKVIREIAQQEDTTTIREKMEDLRETMEIVSALLADRMGAIELALPLAEHFQDTHIGLVAWLDEAEQQVAMLPMPALRPDMIVAQQDKNELLMQRVNEHKPLVEKLNKTGEALVKLCNEEDGMKIQDSLEADTARYAALRAELRSRQQSLEQALQESSQFSDKLEGMLRALSSTSEQVNGIEPVSAHPSRLRDQMEENAAMMDDLAQRSEAYAAVKRAADDVISKAGNRADPAVKDITHKLDKLNKLWADVQRATTDRGHTLDDTLQTAEKFWSELNGVMATLRELQDALACQAPPAAQPSAIQQQQVALQEIRQEIDQTKPDVDQVRASGHELMDLCGEPDKPEVRKHIEDLDQAWDNVTTLYAKREENLIDAMEKAMEFHETLQNLLEFLQEAEDSFTRMGPLGSDIDEVKKQMKQLADFKADVDPHMVKVEALNRQAAELTVRTSSEQASAIKEPLGAVNRRWNILLRGVVERQRLLENALLRLGQFQHALDELLVWIEKTDATLDSLKPVAGDPQVIEVELAKLKVLVNDIQAHQTSVDTLNDAGRQLIEDADGTTEASTTSEKLGTLNRRWRDLLQRAADRQRGLEDALKEAQTFTAEIQDLLFWLGDVDNTITASKPVGGLPETASEQLDRFSEVYNELEQNRPKMETVLQQGQEYLKRADMSNASWLNHNLRTLKQRWENVSARASDKKIKLEIALKEATEFHEALQQFVDWLTDAEKTLTNLRPASRVMETILTQIEEHKAFQKDVGVHRETMLNLDKKGTHLKYFSQKQDVILIKNLLISVQHRWERVVSKSAERTRALDHGYKEAREFHDAWSNLMNWLDETEKTLDEVAADGLGGNDPERIKSRLNKHREIQKALSAKQGTYDFTMKTGKALKDRAPGSDEAAVAEQLNELKNKWTTVCGKCVDRQRKLEEALLFSGQFKDAIQALLEWLTKSEKQLSNAGPLHGDLDTVTNLVEQHRTFEKDLESRVSQMESVNKTGHELLAKASNEDLSAIDSQLSELSDLWDLVKRLSSEKSLHLEEALREAERLHKAVNHLLEWLSDAEMKLRFAGQLPEDEQESRHQLIEHEKFLRDLCEKEVVKDETLELAHSILAKAHPDGALVIKHWITIIQSRWEEVATWAQQRNQRLENHMRGLQDLDNLLEELLAWLEGLENTLNALEAEPLPDDRATLEMLITDHREFMENTSQRQNEVDRVCKARQMKPARDMRKLSKAKSPASARSSPGRERTPDLSLPHIGPRFPPKGSKGSEPEFRSPRVKLLWDRWRHVWMLAWERQRRLQDKYNYIQEVDRVANFSWEDWRKRFLKFMNHKKSRLTDLFRKMDKNNDGMIPREDFIHGIMNTKFETSRLEMSAVADLFDRHGEGLIDWKEFIAALRPDWEERRTYNDTDKIHDEVKRLVMLCTCRQKFRVFQVGEGKYRFGDSQKLRLVRILRSTVMVRVGGGWVALDEFLLKNDPCRAKGRTNIELREQFILADGVSQTMTAFRSKPSPSSTIHRAQIGSPCTGPITKVRERSARSVPMGQPRASRSSLNAGTPDSLSDNESSFRVGTARKTSTPHRSAITPGGSRPSSRPASRPASRPTSRPGSRPASRQGSKPSSRYGSTQSLDSTDDSSNPSRIPRRTSLATAGTTPTSSRHNSVSGKRLASTPVNGSSSRPRTPTGLISPASGTSARFSTIHRASSIPILTGVGTPISRSRIPVYVGTDIKSPQSTTSNISTRSTQSNHSTVSTDSTGSSPMCTNSATNIPSAVKQARTQTPSSGASTPLPHSLKLSRKPTVASDTSASSTPTGRRGKPTPIDQRAPFRL